MFVLRVAGVGCRVSSTCAGVGTRCHLEVPGEAEHELSVAVLLSV